MLLLSSYGSISISVIANDEGYNQSHPRFLSILAKDPPILHHGLRMDRNRRLTAYRDEISSLITVLEMLSHHIKKCSIASIYVIIYIKYIQELYDMYH